MVEEGRLRYIEVSDVKADIWKQLIYHKTKWHGAAMRALISFISEREFLA